MTRTRLVVAPVVVVAVAFVLALVSDRLLYIGPLDRATFGWLVVMPMWAAAPTFAGFSWRGFAAGLRTRYALLCGSAVGGVTAILLWQDAAAPKVGCTPSHTPLELMVPALLVGLVVGGGFALACRIASGEILAQRVGRGVIYGAVIQLLIIPLAFGLATYAFFGLCQRP